MNLAEWLYAVANKQGLDPENPALKLILSDGNLTKLDVPAELNHVAEHNLKEMLTLDAAKNHPELKKHFFATSMYGVEKDIDKYAKEIFELSDEDRAELKKVDGAQKRLESFLKIAKERTEKKAPPTDNEKVKKLSDEIARLNETILKKDEEFQGKEKSLKQTYLESLKDRAIKDLFHTYEYTDALPKQVQIQTAQALWAEKLRQDKNKVVFNEESDSLQLFTEQDTEVYKDNKPMNLKQYVESLLAENKLLKVTPTQSPGDGKKKEPILVATPSQNGSKLDTSAYMQEVNQALQDLSSKS